MNIILVADFLLEDMVRGAQLTDEAMLLHLGLETTQRIRSKDLKAIDNNAFYILSSFFQLSDASKFALQQYGNYIIFEHDHGYVPSRNPFMIYNAKGEIIINTDGKVSKEYQIHRELYKKAQAVICLTKWHENQLSQNLEGTFDNIGGASWNLQSLDDIDSIRESANKKYEYCFFNDNTMLTLPNGQQYNQGENIKNKKGALDYCITNKLKYKLLPRINDNKKFLSIMCSFKGFIFFPIIPETCSRILTEAKMLGLEVITNSNSGAYHEPWFKLNGQELTDHFRNTVIPHSIEIFRKYLP